MKFMLRLLITILVLSVVSCQSPSVNSAHVPDGYTLQWSDEFEASAIDTASWTAGSLRDSRYGDLVPGAKGDHLLNDHYAGYITTEDSYLENGSLVLRNQKRSYTGHNPAGTYSYTSGWVMSMHKIYFNKGYLEIKARFPAGDKVWPALWLIAEDLTWGPEWDIFEYFGYREDVGFDNMGVHLYSAENQWHSAWLKQFDKTFRCDAWHIYGFEWTDQSATWYIDGKKVHELLASQTKGWPDENMYLVLNNGQRSESPDSATVWPNALYIDYVKLYQKNK
jgi:beta-glucanase (GH16 family)